jgi:proteasome lid subunit RPN8/RPN11
MAFKFKSPFKKKRPIEVFQNIKDPHLEEAYVKFPGKRMKRVSKKRNKDYVTRNDPLIKRLQRRYGKKYTLIHTHPGTDFLPSGQDIVNFLHSENRRASVIVPLDKRNDYQPDAYFVMRKNKAHKGVNVVNEDLMDMVHSYRQSLIEHRVDDIVSDLKRLAGTFGFDYRLIPADGYTYSEDSRKFRSNTKSLESGLTTTLVATVTLIALSRIQEWTGHATSTLASDIHIGMYALGAIFIAIYLVRKLLYCR